MHLIFPLPATFDTDFLSQPYAFVLKEIFVVVDINTQIHFIFFISYKFGSWKNMC